MVDRDDHDVAFSREVFSVIGNLFDRGAHGVTTTVEPDHDGTLLAIVDPGRPDIQIQAIVVHAPTAVRQ